LRIGFLPEDRKSEGLLLNFSLKNNISLPSLKHFNWLGFMRRAAENDAAQEYISKLQIKTTGPNQEVRLLSGGNQQKVVLAKWLQTNANMLIFDEPTRGIDVAAKEEFYKIILECAMRGAAVLLISSEISELIRMSDRIVVMREGRIAGELDRSEFDPERLLSLAFGQSSLQ
jgi:ribose transport system ATP-binding protein